MKYSELNGMSNYQLNLLLLKKEVDWEDLQGEVEGKDYVNWGDGFNWYSYDPTGDISLAGELIQKYKLGVFYNDNTKHWCIWVNKDYMANVVNENLMRAIVIASLLS